MHFPRVHTPVESSGLLGVWYIVACGQITNISEEPGIYISMVHSILRHWKGCNLSSFLYISVISGGRNSETQTFKEEEKGKSCWLRQWLTHHQCELWQYTLGIYWHCLCHILYYEVFIHSSVKHVARTIIRLL